MQLPARTEPAWRGPPPDPLDDPALYDGVLWRRVLGFLVDGLLIVPFGIGLWFLLTILSAISFGLLMPVQATAMALLPSIYAAVTIHWLSATPGMRLFDLSVRDWNGRPAGLAQGFLMAILFYASVSLTAWIILLVALFSDRRRTLHDMLAGTVVVRAGRIRAPT